MQAPISSLGCSAPQPTFQLALVPNGSSVTVVWDGHSVQNGVLQPVAPGLLTVVVDYLISAGANLVGVQQAEAMFDLPACGAVVVPVALP